MSNFLLKTLAESDLPIPGAEPWHARPEDPALTVMTDFRERSSVTTADSVTIDAALEHMKHAGVRCAFATNATRRVVGLITAYDIMGEKPMRFLQSVGFSDRSITHKDILVRDIMEHATDWEVTEMHEVEKANVQNILEALQKSGRTHLPVLEECGRHLVITPSADRWPSQLPA